MLNMLAHTSDHIMVGRVRPVQVRSLLTTDYESGIANSEPKWILWDMIRRLATGNLFRGNQ